MKPNNTSPFVANLFRVAAPRTGNAVLSPHSVAVALGIIALGACGETLKSLLQILRLNSLSDLQTTIATDEASFRSEQKDGFQYESDTSIWINNKYRALWRYRHNVKKVLRAHIQRISMDEEGRAAINRHVADVTHDLIPEILKLPLCPSNILVATNALWLKAKWAMPFDPDRTSQQTFHAPKQDVAVPFLRQTACFAFFHWRDIDAIRLPYAGENVDFIVILPHRNISLTSIEQNQLDMLVGCFQDNKSEENRLIDVSIPKLSLAFQNDLDDALKSIGGDLVFSDRADFSKIAKTDQPIMLSKIVHDVHVCLDEQGTEAAAATGEYLYLGSLRPPRPKVFCVNRPFLFLVRHRKTGAILFLGRVEDPTT